MRVVEGGNRARFALEPQTMLRIVAVWTGRQLQGNRAAQARVTGAVHLAHTALAYLFEDLLRRTEPFAIHSRGPNSWVSACLAAVRGICAQRRQAVSLSAGF